MTETVPLLSDERTRERYIKKQRKIQIEDERTERERERRSEREGEEQTL
jgi:hypothetical protein